jgi:hypothetical protein
VLAAVILATLLLAALLGVRVATGGGPSGAVVAGEEFVHPGHPADLAVVHHGTGYDGQFVYRLALDPFTRAETAYGITLDNPPYRQQRIGLPLAAWALSRTGLPVSWSLLLVNAAALVAAAGAGAVLARRLGRHAFWGVAVGLSPALVVAVTRDLTEPLTAALLLLGVVAWTAPARRAAPRLGLAALGAVAFTGSLLTRETTLAVLAGLGLWEAYVLLRPRTPRPDRLAALARGALLLVPLAAYLLWQHHLGGVWGELPLHATDGDVGVPFVTTMRSLPRGGGAWADWASKGALLAHGYVAERLLLLAVLAAAAWSLRRSRLHPGVKAGWVAGALLALAAAWTRDVAFLRAANEATLLGVVVLLGSRTRASAAALCGVLGLSAYVAVVYGALL